MKIIAKQLVAQSEHYVVSLKPQIDLPASKDFMDVTHVSNVAIPFNIEIEARQWGIKSFALDIVAKPILIDVWVKTAQQEDLHSVQVDLTQLELRLNQGNRITISNLYLSLTQDFTVDYNRSYVEGETFSTFSV